MKIIATSNSKEYTSELSSMHRLRHKVFKERLNWPVNSINFMEFDQYDVDGAHYIVRKNEFDEIDATCRIMPTQRPNMFHEHFMHFVDSDAHPLQGQNIWEITRFCADHNSPRNITGQLCAAIVEFGLSIHLTSFIAIIDTRIIPALKRSGWTPILLGEPQFTGTEKAVAVAFPCSVEALAKIKGKSRIENNSIIENMKEIKLDEIYRY